MGRVQEQVMIEAESNFIDEVRNMLSRRISLLIAFVSAFVGGSVAAEPTTAPAKIRMIRTYNSDGGTGSVYVQLDNKSLCDTDTYKINLAWGGSKQVLATALSAFLADSSVRIEVANAGCTGWGTLVQSIYLVK